MADAAEGVVPRRLLWALGTSQLVCWGVSYYVIAVFGAPIGAEMGWSQSLVYGGFSAALLAMGLVSKHVGRAVDRHGGRQVMTIGSCLIGVSCIGLSLVRDPVSYYLVWILFGVAMRLTLYDAAFAALARIAGAGAKRPISQITLLGGLASTMFWPIGHALTEAYGWRTALLVYAACAVATVPLHRMIPLVAIVPASAKGTANGIDPAPRVPFAGAARRRDAILYAVMMTAAAVLNSGMSAGMIDVLMGLGLAAGVSVWISTLRGVGQSLARLCEVLFGRGLSALGLGIVATGLLLACFVAGPFGGVSVAAAVAFAFLYGAGNGLVTIVRGTIPLVLFDPATYGARVGRLLAPSFYLSAASPLGWAILVEHFGEMATLAVSAALAAAALAAAVMLRAGYR